MRIKEVLLAKKDEIGLLELSGSARYGLHAVCRRQPGRTVRECQYALSMATQTEYDTNARGLARVMYTGPATPDNLFYLDDAIFDEPLTPEESAKEYELLKEREKKNKEDVPAEAKKANKHYRPWEKEMDDGRGKMDDGRGKMEEVRGKSFSEQEADSTIEPKNLAAFDLCVEQAGLKVGEMDVWGEHNWHANLMAVLSVGVAKLMSRPQLKAVVAQRLPNYSQT